MPKTQTVHVPTIVPPILTSVPPMDVTGSDNPSPKHQTVPAIAPLTADHRPRPRAQSHLENSVKPTIGKRTEPAAYQLGVAPASLPADDYAVVGAVANKTAAAFLHWAADHRLNTREWTVDDLWYIASEDFAPANCIALPPRRVFLGALKRMTGVTCAKDRRIYNRTGEVLRKTTIYWLPEMQRRSATHAGARRHAA